LKIKSDPQFHVLSPGDTVMLECEFQAHGFNLFDFPVLWRKSQLGKLLRVMYFTYLKLVWFEYASNKLDILTAILLWHEVDR